jgi:hypothetical protein
MSEPDAPLSVPAPASALSPVHLVLSFAGVGLAGGGLLGAMWIPDGDLAWLSLLLPIVTPVSAGLLGLWLAPRVGWEPGRLVPRVILGVAVAGMLNGVLAGLPVLPINLLLGPLMGVFCAIPFLLPLGLVVALARHAQRARAGSLLADAGRRSLYLIAAAAAVFGAPLAAGSVMRDDGRWPMIFVWIALAGAAFALPQFALSLVSLGKLSWLAWKSRAGTPLGEEALERLAREPVPVVDFGVGEGQLGEVVGAQTAYRDGARPRRVFRGSPRRASLELGLSVLLHAVVMAAGLGFGLHGIASRGVPPPEHAGYGRSFDAPI